MDIEKEVKKIYRKGGEDKDLYKFIESIEDPIDLLKCISYFSEDIGDPYLAGTQYAIAECAEKILKNKGD